MGKSIETALLFIAFLCLATLAIIRNVHFFRYAIDEGYREERKKFSFWRKAPRRPAFAVLYYVAIAIYAVLVFWIALSIIHR